MPRHKGKLVTRTFILKLNEEDRQKLDELQQYGINASDEFRKFLRLLHSNKKY